MTQTKEKPSVAKTSAYITRTESFAAKITKIGAQSSMRVLSQTWYHHQLNKFKDGEMVTLEIHNRRPKRSDQQNRYYRGVYIPLIARETGQPIKGMHEFFKGKFLTEQIVEVFGQKTRMSKSTTELGVGEFSEYILAIEELTGVMAPPTENYELAPLQRN